MFIGTIKIDILLPGCRSLKDKRKIVNSIKDKVRAKYNVSITEVDYQEKWQRITFGIVFVNQDVRNAELLSQRILDLFFNNGDVVILNNKNVIIPFKE